MKPRPFTYEKYTSSGSTKIIDDFCIEHGDEKNGIIADSEYDRLFDDLGKVLGKYGTYSEDGGDADFSGYRWVDQIPYICNVPKNEVPPAISTAAGLEAVQGSHRPLAVSFDYHPDYILIVPPQTVYSTFDENRLKTEGAS